MQIDFMPAYEPVETCAIMKSRMADVHLICTVGRSQIDLKYLKRGIKELNMRWCVPMLENLLNTKLT